MEVKSKTTYERPIKYQLREPITIEELYSLMQDQWTTELPGKFRLKKGLFGSFICFDTYLSMQPQIKVKNDSVHVTPVTVSTKSGGVDIKSAAQAIKTMKAGGSFLDVALGAPDYYLKVCDGIEELLKDRMM